MFFTRHSLAFVLLAVLVSSACAAPAPPLKPHVISYTSYTATLLHEDSPSAREQIKTSLAATAFRLGDSGPKKKITFQKAKLEGGVCNSARTCYAYAYIPTEDNPQKIMFGAVVIHDIAGHFKSFHQPIPVEISGEQLKEAKKLREEVYHKFWEKFEPIQSWLPLSDAIEKGGKRHREQHDDDKPEGSGPAKKTKPGPAR
ncbi:hypothetical protein BDP27DRAFT_1419057 [Rhodocollybia butyracea]|uniref:Lipoprotein n=1 Tax=Rhodocollybia butyracea TaxID=206335 RepID=A0A9P5U9X8_9AGAR|nr:hypothetical protein BDP27DRAFT_1419057 [Rhodocollybia butyracea]